MSIGGGSAGRDNDTGRLEAFSDGVFAIAITLLIIEIGVPHLEEEPPGTTLPQALVGLWPSYLGYVISFLQIGVIWANHHNRFRLIERSDHGLLFLNIVFLMCVAFIPFPTALLAEYLEGSGPERETAGVIYAGTLAVTALFFTLLWLYAAANRLVDRDLDPSLLRVMTRRYLLGTVAYLLVFLLAFVNVAASLILIIILALLFVLPEPSDRGRKEGPRRARGGGAGQATGRPRDRSRSPPPPHPQPPRRTPGTPGASPRPPALRPLAGHAPPPHRPLRPCCYRRPEATMAVRGRIYS